MTRVLPAADVTVAELLRAWPDAARVFLRSGMACVGCELSIFDTLAEVADSYGLDVQKFLAELADAAGQVTERREAE